MGHLAMKQPQPVKSPCLRPRHKRKVSYGGFQAVFAALNGHSGQAVALRARTVVGPRQPPYLRSRGTTIATTDP
jgi:hypothetical protein